MTFDPTTTPDAFLQDENAEESNSQNPVVTTLAVTGVVLIATAAFGYFMRKHFENKAEEQLWNEATRDLDLR
jgi:hypothetical protein